MGSLVDTHCHLVLLEEWGLLEAALESAAAAGVGRIVTVGLDLDDSDKNRRLAEAHAGVWFTVGWHPHIPAPPDRAQLRALGELLRHPRAVAVGEIGLDYFWRPGYHEVPADVQKRSLRAMLELAVAYDKPVVVHDRDAHEDVVAELAAGLPARGSRGRPAGVFHCFSGGPALVASAQQLGMLCSFAGTLTYPRTEAIRAAARAVTPDAHVVETDAPFLAPVPHRGRPNLPGYVAATAAALAVLRGEPDDVVTARCTANAERLFGLPRSGDDHVAG
ncbi:MAG TPA: TatD family hydrolase [Candidatus Dormibacteraeota bacterium]